MAPKSKASKKPKPGPKAARKAKPASLGRSQSQPPVQAPAAAELGALSSRLEAMEKGIATILALLERGLANAAAAPPRPAAQAPFTAKGAEGADPDTAQFLSRTPLFAKLSPQECSILASHCEGKQVTAGQVVFSEGDFGDAMYIVKQGALNIFKKDLLGDVRIAEIRPGGLVGEMALVDGKPRSANVRASEATRLLSLSRASYGDLKKSHPQVATKFQDELLLLISSRLRQTTEKLVGK
jgi:CRP/FNR family cyclic AMP-dependent transcriptional regulator